MKLVQNQSTLDQMQNRGRGELNMQLKNIHNISDTCKPVARTLTDLAEVATNCGMMKFFVKMTAKLITIEIITAKNNQNVIEVEPREAKLQTTATNCKANL